MINKIKNMIKEAENRSISYSEYISKVLYDGELGYYMKDKNKIGKDGDFYTNSNVHSVFGKVLCRIFIQLIQKGILPPIICEIGAGTGRLANYILNEWNEIDPISFEKVQYYIVETSPYHRKEQQSIIKKINKVLQFESIEDMTNKIGKFTGIILSNELFDAFPVDVLQKVDDQFFEVSVSLDKDENLVEKVVQCKRSELLNWLKENNLVLENGQRIEIPIAMSKWLEQTEDWFEKGIMFTIDYGYTNEEWMEPLHRDGSLRGYYKHKMINNPLLYPGEMDLTTHIHLDAAIQKGKDVGMLFLGMLKQNDFLLRGGILEYLQDHYDPNPFSEVSKQNRAIRTLLLDDGISSSFTVLIQKKEMNDLNIKDVLLHDTL